MKKQNFAICDLEVRYAYNLMEYMSQRQKIPFEVLVFAEVESLKLFTEEHAVDLLLISERMMCDAVKRLEIGKIMILTEGGTLKEYSDYPAIYKYQASDRLVCEVMNYCAQESREPLGTAPNRSAQVYGIYSPVRRCGKTCFALTLGQMLARKQSVMYLNLEAYSGFGMLTGQQFTEDLSDVMYFIRQKQGNLIYKLHAITRHLGRMDYIPPAFSAADLREVRIEEWRILMRELMRIGGYDVVLLDLGELTEDTLALLAECDSIFSPTIEDLPSRSKIAQYETLLEEMEYEEILERTEYLHLPFTEITSAGEYFLEQLVQSEMGSYVNQLLAGRGRQEAWSGSTENLKS
ncbi:MAG: hypothetical protein Q4B57_06015 [Eubacteriales bacterium]|nr:hypothetical protein [Eubacteriales bacterium]